MRYVSTRGAAHGSGVTLRDALFDPLAPDGGLYVPESIPRWSEPELARLRSLALHEIGARLLAPFVSDEIDEHDLCALVVRALDFPIPLVPIGRDLYALELFHGPTLAFKDVAARVMARLMESLRGATQPVTILVATSGDTGSAVAHAFAGMSGVRVAVLYPHQRVSRIQEAQLTAFNGDDRANVRAYAVDGTFDDCQRLVKAAFRDPEMRAAGLTSANSINIGRLLPQMIYYAELVARLSPGAAPIVAVPSGNFGNLTAGVMALRAGFAINRFVAATTVNDVVPQYLATGRFEPRPSVATTANAMDVGDPSNFERLAWLYGGRVEAMRMEIVGSVQTDDGVRDTIREVYERVGYLLDPHSAIAYRALRELSGTRVLLATAHPAKFGDVVEPIVSRPIDVPPALAQAIARGRRLPPIHATLEAVRAVIAG